MLGNLMNSESTTIFPVKVAEARAEMLRSEDDGWTYTVRINPADASKAIIEIRDEDGIFLGNV